MQSLSQISHLRNFRFLALFFFVASLLVRIIFFIWSGATKNIFDMTATFGIGFIFDCVALVYAAIPWILLGVLFPPLSSAVQLSKIYLKTSFALLTFMILFFSFISVSEITFWNEFHSRFNFIAVDYLIYTTEVLKNIWESYPLGWILFGIALFSTAISLLIRPHLQIRTEAGWALRSRIGVCLAVSTLVACVYFFFPAEINLGVGDTSGAYGLNEVSKNGLHSLFAAYFHNELDYDHFYLTNDMIDSFRVVHSRLAEDGALVGGDLSIARQISSTQPFQKYNVIVFSMESMSANFMKAYGSKQSLTPNLDRLTQEGLFFPNIFATGTRTVRGLEALTISIPPTPGQSILRRPHNENLYNIGNYLSEVGYETEFHYGGFGYFDNMNGYFSANGFAIWDQGQMTPQDITFKNAWGACDEDLFHMAIQRADFLSKENKPFFQLIMTTSNHRPYTYPQKIDIPSGTGRDGAVKYSDYAIGEFFKAAQNKPWFHRTIFVFVADHDAAVAGGVEVPVRDFRIPLIFYAPGIIKPQKIGKLGSQIDVAPTILGLLHANYRSYFFGHDLIKSSDERAFIGTYQKIGLLRDHILTLLGPNKKVEQFTVGDRDGEAPLTVPRPDLIKEAISFYQSASYLFKNGKMQNAGDAKPH